MEYKENGMDQRIRYVLDKNSRWNGSQDNLWNRVEAGIEYKKSWWRGFRMRACTAVVLVVVAVLLYYIPKNNASIVRVKYLQNNAANIYRLYHPAVTAEIKLPADEYNPGDIMNVKASLKALQEKVTVDSNTLSVSIDRWGSDVKHPFYGLPITSLAGKSINPGRAVEGSVTLKAPEEPGWYRANLFLNLKREDGSTISSSSSAEFFVKYPAGSIRTGKLDVNKTILAAGHKVVVSSITMTEKDATLNYTISDVHGGDGLGIIKLIDDSGNVLYNLREKEETLDGRVIMSITFSPLQQKTKKLTIEVHDIPKTTNNGVTADHGPWILEIDLP